MIVYELQAIYFILTKEKLSAERESIGIYSSKENAIIMREHIAKHYKTYRGRKTSDWEFMVVEHELDQELPIQKPKKEMKSPKKKSTIQAWSEIINPKEN